ncbi:type II toxin-antitoxin system VapC family toxin [Brevundimonas sp. VNH65]|uniref:type II toxin-antitoxin system VapC family toxin n=1 Tax=Brevundimonas sp. VNH65 TaxID=3400917 RepID=UPI003BFE5F97
MSRPILLDTCAAIWLAEGSALSDDAESALRNAETTGVQVLLSPMTAWEVGMLVSKERLALTIPPLQWFNTLLELGIDLAPLSPEILVASSQLPGPALRDPADRIIAATARSGEYHLMTRDRPLLDFAAGGHVIAIPC